ncbi:MAG: DUF1592 domain-containing protein [Bryobacterales bacterium]|nr:DUF1592 domain-containing protein [Bryobacterales bacterium]
MRIRFLIGGLALAGALCAAPKQEFAESIRPALEQHCAACHDPQNPNNHVGFLKARSAADVAGERKLWHNVASQLRNRTMPPADSKLSEEERFRISTWIEQELRDTACSLGDRAGAVTLRRLNRREYRNTIRDLLGVDLAAEEIFPADGSGGEGFDTNAETLYLPPLLMERYMEAAQQILDRTIVSPPLHKLHGARELLPGRQPEKDKPVLMQAGEEALVQVAVYVDDDYEVKVTLERSPEHALAATLELDGIEVSALAFPRDPNKGVTTRSASVHLARGVHTVAVVAGEQPPVALHSVEIVQAAQEVSAEKRALHYRLFGIEPGEPQLQPRKAARVLLGRFVERAFRRPVAEDEVERYMRLYDRGAERGDPYVESVKLALKGVLVSPDFLFRVEKTPAQAGPQALSDYELATRLSYFLWSTMPDEELLQLAAQGKLQDETVLRAQVARLLDDPRARVFATTFIGQWFGTKDVGGRVAPTVNEVQHFYTPEVARDMREEPVLLFQHILGENRSLLELIDSDYGFLTERLAKFYELGDEMEVGGDGFRKVQWTSDRRGGVLGLGAVLAMTSHFKQNSPVLRGAWVLEALLGTPVPSPPPDVPPLETEANKNAKMTIREKLSRHRENPFCAACHDMIDPIGFGLENFDWLGRWRDQDNGKPIDAAGVLPSGERFDGPAELRRVLLRKKDEFIRHLTGKTLGYALGRGLEDGDHCTVQRIADGLAEDGYRARTLIESVVLSTPFRYVERAREE